MNLFEAAKNGDIDRIKQLLKEKVDINAQFFNGLTALMAATDLGHTDIVKLLVKSRADVNICNNGKWTALMAAAQQGHVEIVKILIASGADLDAQDEQQWTALMRAKQKNRKEIIQLLKKAGAKEHPYIMVCHNCGARWQSMSRMAEHLGKGNIHTVGERNNCPECGMSVDY